MMNMFRIRLCLLLCLLGLSYPAHAATTVEQQGAWVLRTATSNKMTKDYFCAAEGRFDTSHRMIMARNIIGQTSLIVTWPGFNGAVGSQIPLRLNIDKNPLRDAQATIKAPNLLVVPFGWDDDVLNQLTNAKKITLNAANASLQFNIKDSSKAFTRLNSCTASLADRLPPSSNLSGTVSKALTKSGFGHAKTLAVNDSKNNAENFLLDDIFGGTAVMQNESDDITQTMLSYVDQLELMCRSRFTSELGAATPISGGEITTADAKCDAAHTGTFTALAFVKTGGKPRVYYFEGEKNRAQQLKSLRDILARNLQ